MIAAPLFCRINVFRQLAPSSFQQKVPFPDGSLCTLSIPRGLNGQQTKAPRSVERGKIRRIGHKPRLQKGLPAVASVH